MSEDKKNVYVTLHKDFVRTGIEYADRATGETRAFNSVTLPKGTVIDGVDVSYYQFSPMFVNPSKYRGENFVDIPLLTNREVWMFFFIGLKTGKITPFTAGLVYLEIFRNIFSGTHPDRSRHVKISGRKKSVIDVGIECPF